MKKVTLSRKILAGLSGCTIVLLILAFISFKNRALIADSSQWVNHTHEVLNVLMQILVNADEAEVEKRGFVITGDESFLPAFNQSTNRVSATIRNAKQLTKDNPTQQLNLARIEKLSDTLNRFLKTCIKARQTEGFEKARALVQTGEGRRLLDELRNALDTARKTELRLLTAREQTSKEDNDRFNLLFTVLLVVMVIVLVALYLIITSNLRTVKKLQDETNARNWSLTGSSDLSKIMQGNKPLAELSQDIINHLTAYIGASVGALYITGEQGMELALTAAYAAGKEKTNRQPLAWGEDLAGQSAAEKKTLLLKDIPAGQFTIHTGFGQLPPKNIIAIPIIFETTVTGVIELGSLHDVTEQQQQYLQLVMDNIAIAITSCQGREKTKELLEETQRQAEELDAQQEELKQANETLYEKNILLGKSEAELKAQQEELQQTNEELEEKANLLEEQKERLEATRGALEGKAKELELTSRYKSEFLANMSHELRTPLNSILILAQLLKENKHEVLGPKEVEYAGNIFSSGTDLLNLINEILDLSKVEAGKIELDIAETDLAGIAGNLQSMFGELAKTKSVRFDIRYEAEQFTHPLSTDRQRLEQILRNLLSNAFKFTGKGGRVSLTIDKAAPPGPVAAGNGLPQQPDTVAFTVTDSGIGIPADKQETIFQAFQQADGSTKRKYGGTGLGLSISRELAHALGGDILLRSEEGKGSSFTLYLPLQFAGATPVASGKAVEVRQAPDTKPVRRETYKPVRELPGAVPDDRYSITENDRCILVIEDDAGFAKLLLQFFREHGYKCIIADQGNTGLSLARYYRPDAIILDMQLPVMDGAEVLKHLKNDPELRHIPVQIFSGHDRRKESMDLGAFDFIRKPVLKEDLQGAFDKISDFLRKKLKRLLVVEDNRQHNQAIRELIGNGDVDSFSAYAGSEAYQLMQQEKFDCVIIDLGLPDMSGFDLLEKIKASDVLNKIPIIVYTGKDLSREETGRLNKLANTVVLKTANSTERLLDEATLFLHRVESKLPKEKQQMIRRLHRSDEVLKDKTVLVVDDDMRNIYSLTNALEDEGLRCITAENGREALQLLQEQPGIDIVLMDIMMPEMDGYEATQAIRAINGFDKLPIIALTAKAMKGDREKCLEAGMSDYIAKPVNIEQLLSLMRVWLYR
jgi:CheY-like chemotaxis protein/CHASE3 domain sensor protein